MNTLKNPRPLVQTLIIAAIASLAACGGQDPGAGISSRQLPIIGGQPCGPETFSASVGLILEAEVRIDAKPGFMRLLNCTGTLIAPDAVLTAAHCLDLSAAGLEEVEIVAVRHYVTFEPDATEIGNPELLEIQPVPDRAMLPALPADAVAARAAISHPSFRDLSVSEMPGAPDNVHDVGLLLLQRPVTGVAPAAVIAPAEVSQLAAGLKVSVVGWGMQIERDPFGAPPKGKNGRKICGESSIAALGSHEMHIGAAAGEAKKCTGDSGGPVFARVQTPDGPAERLIGVASRTFGETHRCEAGTIETRVDAWREWIDEQLRAGCASQQRAWCEVAGIPPVGSEPPAPGTTSGAPDPKTADAPEPGGCQLVAASPLEAPLLALVALLLLGLRRRTGTR